MNLTAQLIEVPTEMITTYGMKVDKKKIADDTDPMLAVVKKDVVIKL